MRIRNPFIVRESNNLEFWVSNLVIVLSTVLGVYLAAQAGYHTAVEFEAARSEREGYYLRRALLEEVKDNAEQADQFANYVTDGNGWRFSGNPDDYKLQSYVWETMQEHSITFQLPSAVLTGVRRYHEQAKVHGREMARGGGGAVQNAQALREETKKVRASVLPALEASIGKLKQRLEAKGVTLD